jgi:hypothetical protein
MKRKTEIIFETEDLTSVKIRRRFAGSCRQCNAPSEMLPTDAAAALVGLSEREVFRLIEREKIHFVEAEWVFVCRESLMNRLEKPTRRRFFHRREG